MMDLLRRWIPADGKLAPLPASPAGAGFLRASAWDMADQCNASRKGKEKGSDTDDDSSIVARTVWKSDHCCGIERYGVCCVRCGLPEIDGD
ncbi:hypothetical protein CO653_30430 [Rhizobium anhuiense]|nr:hypothetical protein CO653_30430 [Rhizobium anhuiense]